MHRLAVALMLALMALAAGWALAGYGRPGLQAVWLAGLSLCR